MATNSELELRVEKLFSARSRDEAVRLLHEWEEEITSGLVGALGGDPNRLLFAAAKVSHGDLGRLRKAMTVGQVDFRDLLSAAGFGGATASTRSHG